MAQKIPSHFIDELLSRTNIIGIIKDRIAITKKGHDYMGCCPFHEEKTPSFSASEKKQFFYCFGCGAHGNAIGFLMQYDKMDFRQAVETLCAHAGLTMPDTGETATNVQPLFDAMAWADEQFQQQLKHPQAQTFLKERHINQEVAKTYGLGFAPPGWQFLCQHQANTKHTMMTLITLGLVSPSKDAPNQYFDRFRQRFMFPIRDERGRTIAFGGRTMTKEQQPKYLNSPEHPIFQKRQTIYGLYEAKQATRQLDALLIVEGYMDVIALACHGVSHAVATLGTAVTAAHMQTLFKHTDRLIFCFDGDAAGQKAAWRACELSLPLMHDGREVCFLFLPDGEDPDSYIQRNGKNAWQTLLKKPTALADFFFDHCASQHSLTDTAGLAAFAKTAKQHLEKCPHGIYKTLMMQRLSDHLQLPVEQVLEPRPAAPNPIKAEPKNAQPREVKNPLLLKAIQLALHFPNALKSARLEDYPYASHAQTSKAWTLLCELVAQVQEAKTRLNTASLLARMQDHPNYAWLIKQSQKDLITPESGAQAEWASLLLAFDLQQLEAAIQELIKKHKYHPLSDDEKKQLQTLLKAKSSHKYISKTDS